MKRAISITMVLAILFSFFTFSGDISVFVSSAAAAPASTILTAADFQIASGQSAIGWVTSTDSAGNNIIEIPSLRGDVEPNFNSQYASVVEAMWRWSDRGWSYDRHILCHHFFTIDPPVGSARTSAGVKRSYTPIYTGNHYYAGILKTGDSPSAGSNVWNNIWIDVGAKDNGDEASRKAVVDNRFRNEIPSEIYRCTMILPKEVAEIMEGGNKVIPIVYPAKRDGNESQAAYITDLNSVKVVDFRKVDEREGVGRYTYTIEFKLLPAQSGSKLTTEYFSNPKDSNNIFYNNYGLPVGGFENLQGRFACFEPERDTQHDEFSDLSAVDGKTGKISPAIQGRTRIGGSVAGYQGGGAQGLAVHGGFSVAFYNSGVEPKAAYTYVNEAGSYINPQTGVVVASPLLTNVPTEIVRINGVDYWDANWNISKAAISDTIVGITSVENTPLLGSAYSQANPGRTVETQANLGVTINTSLPVTITGAVTNYREAGATINETTSQLPNITYPVFTDASKTGSTRNNFYNYSNTDSVLYKIMVYTKPPYTPPPGGAVEPVFWANSSKAFAEIKQGTYSDNRATESWEAMAGVPHDESMYVNAGASAILMAVSRTTVHQSVGWQTTNNLAGDTSLSSKSTSGDYSYSASASSCSEYSASTHCSDKCNGSWCHGCTIGSCHNGCGTNHPISCSHYVPSSGTPGEPGYSSGYYEHSNDGYNDYGAHHNCSSGSCPDQTGSTSETISQFSLYYYTIDSYKYYRPESFTLNTTYFPASKTYSSSFNTALSQSNASLTVANNSKDFSYSTCGDLKANFLPDVDNHYKNDARPTASFIPQTFSLTDINGNVYNYLGTVSLSFTGQYDATKGTIIYSHNGNGHKMDESRVNNDSRHLYADEVAAYSTARTNWMPHVESWNEDTKVPVRGYAGNPASASRNTAGTLFYGAGYTLKSLLPNGPYISSPSPVQWRLQGSGGANARILPSFDAPTVIRMSNTSVEPTYTKGAGYAASGSFTTVPNSIIVHSPNALGEMKIYQSLLPGQEYIEPSTILSDGSSVLDSHVRLGQSFKLNWNHQWSAGPRMSNRGITEIDTRTWGMNTQGYIVGLDTLKWIAAKYIRFSYEVIYNGTRYAENSWINVPKSEMTSTFHVPMSNNEELNGYYEAKVVAYNAPGGPSPTSTDVETVMNISRTGYRAKHGANRTYLTSVLGTIGNFAIQYTTDPNWEDYFATKYVATEQNMFGFKSSDPVGRYLDPFNTIPSLNKSPTKSKPLVPGNNGNKNNEPVKMGYPIYYSIQTVGNYKNCTMRVDANYRVVKYSGGAVSYIDVDLYYRDGNAYKKLFPNAEGSIVSTNVLNNSTYPVSGLEQSNSTSWGGISFSSGNKSNILGPGLFRLPVLLRTLIGYMRDYTYTTQYPAGGNHTLKQHAENAQRWHGVIYLPSSTVAVPRGTPISDSAIVKGDGVMLTCELKFTTEGGSPFNLSTNEGTMYTPTPGKVRATVTPPGSTTGVDIEFPANTVVVFDINKNSSKDAGTSGTH